ncbi:MAG: UDP-glucose dehydrogenase family protein [Candidatus Binataceae bacterium]
MRVTVVGAGYVGLVTGVCLATKGHDVTCVDLDSEIVRSLNNAVPHFHERDLDGLLKAALRDGTFHATAALAPTLARSEIVLIAVGTPLRNGTIDLTAIRAAAIELGSFLGNSQAFMSVVVKSTVIPGTTDTVVRKELESTSGKILGEFGLGMNPEFLREGEAIADFMEPDRIVLGHEDPRTLKILEKLYSPWNCEKLRVNSRTAELIKYANNALLAVQISAVNEIANLASALGNINVNDVIEGVHLDKRWNPIRAGSRVRPSILSYLVPGCGFGGSCLPKDIRALCAQGLARGMPMHLLNAVLMVNDAQPFKVVETLEREIGDLNGKSCLLLGLSFKPETDDVRESVSIRIAHALLAKGASVVAHDPVAMNNFTNAIGSLSNVLRLTEDWRSELNQVDIIVVATKWPEYHEIASMDLGERVVFDARQMFKPDEILKARYLSLGRRLADS